MPNNLQHRIIQLSQNKNNADETNDNAVHLLNTLATLYPKTINPIVPFISSYPIFSGEECDEIIRYSESTLDFSPQKNTKNEQNIAQFHSLSAYIIPDSTTNYIYNRLRELIVLANNSLWNFELMDFAEPVKIHKYTVGCSTCTHTDIGTGNTNFRKITVVVQLSDENDYTGGTLITQCSDTPCVTPKKRGCVILFPSYMLHKVDEITRGTRYSLVTFAHGPPFR